MRRRDLLGVLAAAPAWAAAGSSAVAVRRVSAWTQASALGAVEAKVDGRPARVVRRLGPPDELLLLVVLDLTGDLTYADPARQAAVAEIEKLPANVWAGVLRSQDGLMVVADPTADRAALATAIQNVQVSGRAGLLETVESAARLSTALVRRSGVRVAVLYLTDSNIYNYREDYTNPVINPSDQRDLSRRFPEALVREKEAKLAARLAESDAPIFITHLAFLRDRLNEAYQTGLQQLAEASGGQAVFCRAVSDIAATVGQTFERLRGLWAIDIEVPAGTARNFSVHLTSEASDLQYRTRFAAAAGGRE